MEPANLDPAIVTSMTMFQQHNGIRKTRLRNSFDFQATMIFIFPFVSMRKSMVVDDKTVWFVGRKSFSSIRVKVGQGIGENWNEALTSKKQKAKLKNIQRLANIFQEFHEYTLLKKLTIRVSFLVFFIFMHNVCLRILFFFQSSYKSFWFLPFFFFFAGISQLFLRTSSCFNALAYVSDNYLYSRRATCFLPVFSTLFHTCFLRKFRKIIKIQHTGFITVRIIILRKE